MMAHLEKDPGWLPGEDQNNDPVLFRGEATLL
jgi:hypothetical protein